MSNKVYFDKNKICLDCDYYNQCPDEKGKCICEKTTSNTNRQKQQE